MEGAGISILSWLGGPLTYLDPPASPAALLAALHAGGIVRFAALPRMAALAALTRAFVEERLAPHAPVEIHRYLPPVELARRLGEVQREYSSSDDVKRAWCALFEDVGLDPADTARDRLVLRFQVHSDRDAALPSARSTATVGFHRDSWGTNLPAQVNWWAPVWPITAGRTFAIYPGLWDAAVPNDSESFDLADVMERVRCAPETLAAGALAPRPTGPVDPGGGVPVVLAPGEVIAFSSAHAHAGIANHTGFTRISLETRTVSIEDVRAGRGAPNVDGRSRWVAPGLFRRLSDGAPMNVLLGVDRLVVRDGW
ncbi:MAG TPA: hypothetical protein VHZ53_02275 [Steroidobacteraceae bacterium]|nr:hypothetical protein [Steroidobacteraceae bacterium]